MCSDCRLFPILALLVSLVLLSACSSGVGRGPAELPRLDSEQVRRGAALYAANCAACHGSRAEGQPNWKTPKVDGSYPAPPHDASGHTWHHGDGTLFKIVQGGGSSLNIPKLNSKMPGFGETMTDEEIIAVLTYIKSLWPVAERQLQAEASQRDPLLH